MISSRFVSRITLQREKVDSFDRYPQVAYEETEHYLVTRDFLANPARMLRILMER